MDTIIKIETFTSFGTPLTVKAHANGLNIVGQRHATLLGPTEHVASVCMEQQQCWHLLALVAYSLKPAKLLSLCKRTQHCWQKTPTTRNNVVTCCVRLCMGLNRKKLD